MFWHALKVSSSSEEIEATDLIGWTSIGWTSLEDSESSGASFLFLLAAASSRVVANESEVLVREDSEASPSSSPAASGVAPVSAVAVSGISPPSGSGGREERKI
jgi:hypothetical protein